MALQAERACSVRQKSWPLMREQWMMGGGGRKFEKRGRT